jgi:hypothetical protein
MKHQSLSILICILSAIFMAASPAKATAKARDKLPQHIQAYLKYRDAEYATALAALRKTLASTKSSERQTISQLEKKIGDMVRAGPQKFVPTIQLTIKGAGLDARPLVKIGQGGRLVAWGMDEDSSPTVSPIKVFQVLTKTRALIQIDGIIFLVNGMSFEGIANDSGFWPKTPLIATGTATYKTAAGASNTVIQLEPFNPDDYKDY